MRKIIAWTVATPLGIRRGPTLLKEVFAPETPPADFPIRAGAVLGLRPTAFYNSSTDFMAAAETLPGYMARYKSLPFPWPCCSAAATACSTIAPRARR